MPAACKKLLTKPNFSFFLYFALFAIVSLTVRSSTSSHSTSGSTAKSGGSSPKSGRECDVSEDSMDKGGSKTSSPSVSLVPTLSPSLSEVPTTTAEPSSGKGSKSRKSNKYTHKMSKKISHGTGVGGHGGNVSKTKGKGGSSSASKTAAPSMSEEPTITSAPSCSLQPSEMNMEVSDACRLRFLSCSFVMSTTHKARELYLTLRCCFNFLFALIIIHCCADPYFAYKFQR